MRLIDVQHQIKQLNMPIFTTNDLATTLNITTSHASHILARLMAAQFLSRLGKGLWCVTEDVEPLKLPEYLTAPFPSYISLQSALYYHGMISQIPEVIYAVSLARTKVYTTSFATISVHHIPAVFFCDYTLQGDKHIKLATPEKALVDFLYLRPAKNALFRRLPELTLPSTFNKKHALDLTNKIPSRIRRTMTQRLLMNIIENI